MSLNSNSVRYISVMSVNKKSFKDMTPFLSGEDNDGLEQISQEYHDQRLEFQFQLGRKTAKWLT